MNPAELLPLDDKPLVSVIVPNFNHGRYLASALSGILSQTYTRLEILITDDGSTDDSRDVINVFAQRDKRVKPVFFPKNQGPLEAFRDALQRGSGQLLVTNAGDDEIINPTFFHQAVEAFNSNTGIGLFFGKALLVDARSEKATGGMGYATDGIVTPHAFVRGFLNLSSPFFVPAASTVYRIDAVRAVGGFLDRLGPQSDYLVNHAIPTIYGCFFANQTFALARYHSDRSSYSSKTTFQDEVGRFHFFAKRMIQISQSYSSREEWDLWWKNRYNRLVGKHFPIPALD
jgi:glycosyltransferase involved in cell wall biosynthesis